ncbi:tyrosine-type recombinase/integrase [Vibrio harveyi]|uniref:tyrosine-type recombinase/integrase n=1 Tax=Vibrio harveyi TaxID=669 RepID=UPI0009387FB9|nr:site-specific integrase [Vibrio harveyi]APP05794.1 integrase [Vibrio harveyi]
MAYYNVERRTLSGGEPRYKTTVFVKKNGRIVHRESKTFKKKALANTFGKNRVTDIEANGLNGVKVCTIGELIDLYMNDKDLYDKDGRTKRYCINLLRDCQISKVNTNELRISDLIAHCRDRRSSGAKPVTISHDISYLKAVMKKAQPVFNIEANIDIFEDAFTVLKEMKLIGKSEKRTRRPSNTELDKLRDALIKREQHHANTIPLTDILDFSILSCMRISEVCGLKWEDLNTKQKTVLVRDRKDPRKKQGNHMIVPLLGGAFDIVMKQANQGDFIFPYNPRSITAAFQRVRNKLGIEDLRYHDLRREGASRLFEKGYSIEEVAQVTGHRNLNTLWTVYTQLFPHKLHDKDERM